jgi:nucleolin
MGKKAKQENEHKPVKGLASASVPSSSEIVRSVKRRVVVEETDGSEEEVLIVKVSRTPTKLTPAKTPEPLRKASVGSDQPKKLAAKHVSSSSESDSPPAKAPPAKKQVLESSSSDDEPPKKAVPKPVAKAVAKPPAKKPVESSESSSDEAPTKPAAKKPVVSDSSSEDEKPQAKKEVKKAPAPQISDEEESSDDEPKLGTKRKASSSSEDSVEKKPKIAPQTAARQQTPKTPQAAPRPQASEGDVSEVFVGGLSWTATEDDVYTLFSTYGTVENVKLLYNEQGQSRGSGFVRFSSPAEATAALGANGVDHMGRSVRVNMAGDKPPPRTPGEAAGPTIFVKNLSYTVTEEAIQGFFSGCGGLKQVRISKDFDGNSKGFAHVEFTTQKSAEAAVQLNGQKLEGRPVTIDFAKARTEGSTPGRGGAQSFGQRPAASKPSTNFTGKKIVL